MFFKGEKGEKGDTGPQGIKGERGLDAPAFQDTAFFARSRTIGVGLMVYLIVQVAFGSDSLIVEISNTVLGVASVALILISDRRCITAKRAVGTWILEFLRIIK
jgi:hypothetical protein